MKYSSWINFCILIAATIGCTPAEKNRANQSAHLPHVLRINFQDGEVTSLHPHIGIDFRVRSLQTALYEGLTRMSPGGVPEPAVAEKIDVSPSYMVYTFHLRPSRWSNGKEVTAYHFESAWKQALSPHSPCARADLLYVIKNGEKAKKGEVSIEEIGVHALGTKTLRVELEHPIPYFLELVANPLFSPLFTLDEEQSVFNGPFIVSARAHNQFLQLASNPYYWDADQVKLDKIDISFITDSSTALTLFEKGELDWIGSPFSDIPFEALPSYEKAGRLLKKDVARIFWIYCNTEIEPFQSATIRKALAFALDRKAIAEHALQGQSPALSPLPVSLSLMGDEHLPLQGDPEKARALLKQGLEELNLDTLPPIILSHSHISGQRQLAEAIQSYWTKELGIQVQIVGSEWNVFFGDLSRGQYQLGGCIKSAFFKDPIYHLELLKDKQHVYNVARWENPLYRKLLDQAILTAEATVRQGLLKEAESILMHEMPVIPIYSDRYQYVLRPEVEGVVIHDIGHVDFKWTDVRG